MSVVTAMPPTVMPAWRVPRSDMLPREPSDSCESAGCGLTFGRLARDMPSNPRLDGWMAVMFAPVSAKNLMLLVLPPAWSVAGTVSSGAKGSKCCGPACAAFM
jgi:hypothetical protein